jgi:hypothetical protein
MGLKTGIHNEEVTTRPDTLSTRRGPENTGTLTHHRRKFTEQDSANKTPDTRTRKVGSLSPHTRLPREQRAATQTCETHHGPRTLPAAGQIFPAERR